MTTLDPDEQAFLDLHAPAEPEHFDAPGYHSGLGATGLPWPATRQPAYRQWPKTITDLLLPEGHPVNDQPEPTPCACPTPPRHATDCPATADLWPGVAPGTPEPVSLPPCTGQEGFCRGHGFHRHTLERAEAAPDPLAPFRALADQYAAKAAESRRHAKLADDDEKHLANQGMAAGWQGAEFLLGHTLISLDNGRTTPDNTVASDDARRRVLAFDAFNAVDTAINAHGHWLPLSVREAIADAILAALDAELEQLRARIVTLEHVAAGNKRHVQVIVPDLERAEDALARVRAIADELVAYGATWDGDERWAGQRILAALNQPTEPAS